MDYAARLRIFETHGVSELDSHIDSYVGYPAIQAELRASAHLSAVEQAQERLRLHVAAASPLHYSQEYSDEFGCNVYVKDETGGPVGSFKWRGAYNKVMSLSAAERDGGLVTVSAGNHAQGVAAAARATLSEATVFMPTSVPSEKLRAVQALGASTVLTGRNFTEAEAACFDYLQSHAAAQFIHPFDDEAVIAGQGTVGLEIFDELPETSHVFLPVGGGGLLAGIHQAAVARQSDARLWGAEPQGAAAFSQSWQSKKRVRLTTMHTSAEGAAVSQIGQAAFQQLKDATQVKPFKVTEEALDTAMLEINDYMPTPVECTAALGIAAMRGYAQTVGFKQTDTVVTVLTGRHRNNAAYESLRLTMAS